MIIFEWICKRLVYLFYKMVFFVEVNGIENIPKTTGAILCPNHISNFDGPLVLSALSRRRIKVLTKKETLKPGLCGWFLKNMGCISVDREKKDFCTLKKCIHFLKDEKIVCIFPEGTRNGFEKGKKLRNGAAFLLLASKKPLIPIGINGNYKLFHKIVLNIGKPVNFEEFYNKGKDEIDYEDINKKIVLNMKLQLTNNKRN